MGDGGSASLNRFRYGLVLLILTYFGGEGNHSVEPARRKWFLEDECYSGGL